MATEQNYYNGVGLGSDKLDTIILSSGSYYGIGYIGLFRFIEDAGIRDDIKHIYGVSAGAVLGLLFAVGMTSAECRHFALQDVDLSKLMEVNARMILNIPDRLGMNDGQYLADTCKRILHDKGLGEYCTFQELYDQRGIDLHLGVLSVFHNEAIVWDRNTRPDMPLWQAVRASTAIPFVYMPVLDYESCDLMCDGGLLNSNLIGDYLRDKVRDLTIHLEPHETLSIVKIPGKSREVGCQAGGEMDGHVYLDGVDNMTTNDNTGNNTSDDNINSQKKCKYSQNFWGLELDIRRYKMPQTPADLHSVTFMDYLSSILYKFFTNQDGHRGKFRRLLQVFNCNKYNIGLANLEITEADFDQLEGDFYQQASDYYNSHLLMATT